MALNSPTIIRYSVIRNIQPNTQENILKYWTDGKKLPSFLQTLAKDE
jgi:hypothetical protein